MARPKDKDVKRLFALSGNQCAMPRCRALIYDESGTATGEVCHIKAGSKGGPRYDAGQSEEERHAFDNLILLCRHHHAVVDGEVQKYPAEDLQQIKSFHERHAGAPELEDIGHVARVLLENWCTVNIGENSGNIAINSPGAIQAQNVTVRTSRKSTPVSAPPGSIGADVHRTGYVQYLINRYNKFAAAQPGRERKFNHGAISQNLRHSFGTNWKLVPVTRFAEVASELHRRIDRTSIARRNKSDGKASYSTFEEYLRKHA